MLAAGIVEIAALVRLDALVSTMGSVAFFGLYTRFQTRASVLANPTRAHIAQATIERPGLTATQLAQEVGLSRGAMRHHIRTLEKAGLVRLVTVGHEGRLYPPAAVPKNVAVEGALRHPLRAAIMRLVAERGNKGLSRRELRRLLLEFPRA